MEEVNNIKIFMEESSMQYSREVEEMTCIAKGPWHDPAPIPEEGKWVCAKQITDISGFTHGIGWCGASTVSTSSKSRR